MAGRKKSETIHLRVSPISKAFLEGLANVSGKTSTQIIEELITEAAEKTALADAHSCINISAFPNSEMNIKNAVTAAQHPSEPILSKLRAHFIAWDTLSVRDKTITTTILTHPQFFAGKTKIFTKGEKIIQSGFFEEIPDVDLKEVYKRMESLDSFSIFKEKNPSWKSTYEMFLSMTEGEG
ncbi:hypothetical protein ACF6ZU_05290 [Pseudomonas migulae]|uniref:hypothetical protein n=1 Tax=Pseudomonas migulae TaxID=78543 RepID=UPI00371349E6